MVVWGMENKRPRARRLPRNTRCWASRQRKAILTPRSRPFPLPREARSRSGIQESLLRPSPALWLCWVPGLLLHSFQTSAPAFTSETRETEFGVVTLRVPQNYILCWIWERSAW